MVLVIYLLSIEVLWVTGYRVTTSAGEVSTTLLLTLLPSCRRDLHGMVTMFFYLYLLVHLISFHFMECVVQAVFCCLLIFFTISRARSYVHLRLWVETCASMQFIGILFNTAVHVVMYYYFYLKTQNIEPSWKKYVTYIQIIQFLTSLVCFGLTLYHIHGLGRECKSMRIVYGSILFNITLLFGFFKVLFSPNNKKKRSLMNCNDSVHIFTNKKANEMKANEMKAVKTTEYVKAQW